MIISGLRIFVVTLFSTCLLIGCSHEDSDGHNNHGHQDGPAVSAGDAEAAEGDAHNDEHHEDGDAEESDHGHDDEIRQAGTHLHGDAKLAIALEGSTLFIELDTPVYNLTGFEYSPQTSEEQAVLADVEKTLMRAAQLFVANSEAGCEAVKRETPVDLGPEEEHESEHDHEDSHSDAVIEFEFQCQEPQALNEIEVRLFKFFPRIEELDVVYLDQTTQRTTTLDPSNVRLELGR